MLRDPKIPFLEAALDLRQAQTQLKAVIPHLCQVNAATLIRHKPGRRALIEYHLDTLSAPLTLLGKIRARGTDWNSYQIQHTLWNQGFNAESLDGFCVPEPIDIIPAWHMWLQRKVSGLPATDVIPTSEGISAVRHIAALAHKLHRAPISTTKTHTLADELRILHDRLPPLILHYPHWKTRLHNVLRACDRLGGYHTDLTFITGIHRDFYSDQVLVDGDRLWLVDLDLYCQGHPGLDIGNFIAHITEQSLRQWGSSNALADQEKAMQEAFLAGWCSQTVTETEVDEMQRAIALYTVLTLVRHIAISTHIPERRPYTEAILDLCETRLHSMVYA